jgi:hypothetical protein
MGKMAGRPSSKAGQGLDDGIGLLTEPAASVWPNIHAVIYPLSAKSNQGAHGGIPGGDVTSVAVCRSRSILVCSSASRNLTTVQTSDWRVIRLCPPLRVNLT